MSHNLNEEQIVWIMIFGSIALGLIYGHWQAAKQKAFMKGFKLGRSISQWNHQKIER